MERDDASSGFVGGASDTTDRRLILNPASGSADHGDRVRRLADERGYAVVETRSEGHATDLAAEAAADGAALLAVAGGDGTLHEALQGLDAADALGDVTLGVVPAGTANLFASHVGIEGIDHGFETIETGERRRIDLGMADGEAFAVSCIAGPLADASVTTSSAMKEQFGSLAFIVSGVKETRTFDALDLDVQAVVNGEEYRWSGRALCVLVGNVRKFAHEGGQANVEDGLFEVVIVEQMPASDLATETVAHRLLGRNTANIDHLRASRLDIGSDEGNDLITFSVDGELARHDELALSVRPRVLEVCVGSEYEPDPY